MNLTIIRYDYESMNFSKNRLTNTLKLNRLLYVLFAVMYNHFYTYFCIELNFKY